MEVTGSRPVGSKGFSIPLDQKTDDTLERQGCIRQCNGNTLIR